jgi:ATP-binding cassette subfamily C protein
MTLRDILQFTLEVNTTDLLKITLVGVIATLFAIFTLQITGIIIDYPIPDANRKLLIQMGLGLLAASFGVVIFQLAQAFAILRLQTKITYDTQAVVWDRLLKLKPTFFRQYSTGDLYNRVSAITQIRNRLSVAILRILFTSAFSLLNLGLLLFYSSTLVLVPLAITLLIFLVTTITSLITRQKSCPLQQLTGEILGLTVQLIGGVSKLRVAASESEAFACWAENTLSR